MRRARLFLFGSRSMGGCPMAALALALSVAVSAGLILVWWRTTQRGRGERRRKKRKRWKRMSDGRAPYKQTEHARGKGCMGQVTCAPVGVGGQGTPDGEEFYQGGAPGCHHAAYRPGLALNG